MKAKNIFVCQICGQEYSKWQGRCDNCNNWNSLAEETRKEEKKATKESLHLEQITVSFSQANTLNTSFKRFSTKIEELDRCLGIDRDGKMGLVQGSVVLLGGQPGIGKSTLLTQVIVNWCKEILARNYRKTSVKKDFDTNKLNKPERPVKTYSHAVEKMSKTLDLPQVMYVCGEEIPQQINLRLQRLLSKSEQKEDLPLTYVTTTDVDAITQLMRESKPELLVVDSIQTLKTKDLLGPAGSLGQVKESSDRITQTAKELNIPTFLIGHVTKDGSLAGPKVLEHLVDVIFELTGERGDEIRFLRTLKNRFGASDEVGVFRLTNQGMEEIDNPSAYFLQSAQSQIPGSGVVCVMEGTRPLLTEVQALVLPSQLVMPRRVGRGVDLSRVQILAAVLQKHCGLPLGTSDIFLSIVGGMKITDTAIDLGLATAIASSLAEKTLPAKAIFIGEIGLMGEIRPVSSFDRRVKEAKRLGYQEIYSYKSHKNLKALLSDLKI